MIYRFTFSDLYVNISIHTKRENIFAAVQDQTRRQHSKNERGEFLRRFPILKYEKDCKKKTERKIDERQKKCEEKAIARYDLLFFFGYGKLLTRCLFLFSTTMKYYIGFLAFIVLFQFMSIPVNAFKNECIVKITIRNDFFSLKITVKNQIMADLFLREKFQLEEFQNISLTWIVDRTPLRFKKQFVPLFRRTQITVGLNTTFFFERRRRRFPVIAVQI